MYVLYPKMGLPSPRVDIDFCQVRSQQLHHPALSSSFAQVAIALNQLIILLSRKSDMGYLRRYKRIPSDISIYVSAIIQEPGIFAFNGVS